MLRRDPALAELVAELLRVLTAWQWRRAPSAVGPRLPDLRDPAIWQAAVVAWARWCQAEQERNRRRRRGDYQTDPYGLDRDVIETLRPLLIFFYRNWWRIEPVGLEHVPAMGRALLVANHSGVLPWDGAMIATAVHEDHPTAQRLLRSLFHDWFSSMPYLGALFCSLGQVAGTPENALRLLEDDELVCTFPEGLRGVGKPFSERYRLARFGRGGFVQIALRTGAPLIPVAVVGAEEIYPLVANARPLAQVLGWPYFPVTPFFPLLGPLGAIPLPSRWRIIFCPPIATADYGPAAADDLLLVHTLCETVRTTIQQTLDAEVAARRSIF